MTVICVHAAGQDLPRAYLDSSLDAEQANLFEEHLLSCNRCQDEIRFISAVRGVAKPGIRLPVRFAAAAIVLVAALGGVTLFRTGPGQDLGVGRLGGVESAPVYLGMAARATSIRADSLFGAAMQAYLREDFGTAANGLRTAIAAGSEPTPSEFFLAASLLMQEDDRRAGDLFARVIARGDTPFAAEAGFYRAKALLRMGRADEALKALRQIAGGDPALAAHAAALADSIEAVTAR